MDLVHMVQQGGPIALLLPGAAMAAVGLGAILGLVNLAKVRVPSALQLLGPAAVLALGVGGTVLGVTQAEQALMHASREMRATLASAGMGIALYTSILAGWLAGGTLLVGACMQALGRVARGGPGRWSPLAALPIGVGLLAGLPLALFSGVAAGAVAAVGGLAVGLVTLRDPDEDDDAARLVPARIGVAAVVAVSALIFAWANDAYHRSMAMEAVAYAAVDARAALVAQAAAEAWPSVVGPLVAGALVCGCAVAVTVPRIATVKTRRTAVHAGLFLLVPIAPTGLLAYERTRIAALAEVAKPYAESRGEELAQLGIDPADSTARRPVYEDATVTVSATQLWVDGERVGEEMREDVVWPLFERLDASATLQADLEVLSGRPASRTVNLEADGAVTLARLVPILDTASAATFGSAALVVDGQGGLAVIDVGLIGEPHPKAGSHGRSVVPSDPGEDRFIERVRVVAKPRLHMDHEGVQPLWLDIDRDSAVLRGLDLDGEVGLSSPDAATDALGILKDRWPDEEDLLVVASPTTTVADLVRWLDAARVDVDAADAYGKPRLLFPWPVLVTGPLPPPEPD